MGAVSKIKEFDVKDEDTGTISLTTLYYRLKEWLKEYKQNT
jgi:hypothetical protein